jgi:hypothetical protein
MKCNAVARQRQQTVSAQAHVRHADVKQPQAAGRSHVQTLMEYLARAKGTHGVPSAAAAWPDF